MSTMDSEIESNNKQVLWSAILLLILGGILFFFSFDRQIVSILKTTFMYEMELSNTKYSLLVTAFMVPYTLMYFFSGIIVDKYGSRYVLTGVVLLMSVATLITGLATSMTGLLVGRVVLGIAESGTVPALTLAIFTWFRPDKRASAFQITNLIQSLGLITAPPFIAWITLTTGWRIAFFIPAATGIIIALLWFFSSRRTPVCEEENSPSVQENKIPTLVRYKRVLTSKPVWALIIARLLTDPFWFFYQYWQVGFMQEKLGLTLAEVGRLMWFPPLAAVIGTLAVCYCSDRLVAKGVEATRARLMLIWLVTCLSPLTFLLPTVTNSLIAIAIMTAINLMCTAWLSMATIMMGGLVPRMVIATAISMMSALGGISSIIFNGFVGSIIDVYGYSVPIYFGALLHPTGAVLLAFFFLRKKHNLKIALV